MRNPLSLEGMVDWLRKQPADGTYDYGNIFNCINCQYLRAAGFGVHALSLTKWRDENMDEHPLPFVLDEVAIGRPRTYGAALARAESLLAGQGSEG